MYALRPGEYVLKFLKIMRLGIYLVLLTTFTVSANGFSQKVKVTLNLEQRSILEITKNCEKFRITVFVPGWMNSGNVGKET